MSTDIKGRLKRSSARANKQHT